MLAAQVLISDLYCVSFQRMKLITINLSFLKLFSFKKTFNILFFNISTFRKSCDFTLKASHNNRNLFFFSGHKVVLYLRWNEHH